MHVFLTNMSFKSLSVVKGGFDIYLIIDVGNVYCRLTKNLFMFSVNTIAI